MRDVLGPDRLLVQALSEGRAERSIAVGLQQGMQPLDVGDPGLRPAMRELGEIRERSGEAWSPSPGAIYPTIQLLTDEGLITTHDQDGKKVSSLTEAGRTAAQELAATKTAPWDEASSDAGEGAPSLRHAIHHLLMATKQVAMAGSDSQRQRATELLDETRRKIYALLASDEA